MFAISKVCKGRCAPEVNLIINVNESGGIIMLKKLLAAGFIFLFVIVLGFARSGYAREECECYMGKFYLYGEVANGPTKNGDGDTDGDCYDPDPSYEHLQDTGYCGFIKICEGNIVQLILAETDGDDKTNGDNIYFAIDSKCQMENGQFICSIEEFEIPEFCGKYSALVHGGNAVVRKCNSFFGDGIIAKGKFLAGPNQDEKDQEPGTLPMFAKMNFIIFADLMAECPTTRNGCNPDPT